MLSLNQTFDETRTIKVLVVPIGTNSLFDEHFQVVSNLRDVPFYELNRPPAVPNQVSPFRYFNWNDGNLLFEFQRYDRVLIGPGDLNNFQSSKRILMIMGLINYPELGATADRIEEEMEYFARRHPNILLRRLFVFNYSFDDPLAHSMVTPLMARIRDPASLVIFPPEGQCGATASGSADGLGEAPVPQEAGLSMVDVHLTEVMSHAALHIVLALEQQLRLCEESRARNILPEGLPMCTIFDEMEDSSATPRDGGQGASGALSKQSSAGRKPTPAPYKKKPSGRIHKWMGDVCMQVCSPRDALEHYAAAIAECRALNETLWLAGALEGYASAVLLLVLRGANLEEILGKELRGVAVPAAEGTQPSESVVDKAVRLAEERAADAVAIYASNIVYCAMEVECLLRLARTLEDSAPVGSNREARVVDYIFRAVTVPGLNSQQQIEVTLEGGLRCHRLGLWRKYALFLYIAALMSADNENYGVAHALIRYACNECGISTHADGLAPSQMTRAPQKGNIGSVPPDSQASSSPSGPAVSSKNSVWESLRGALYSSGALIADEHGDTLSATHYLVGLMRLIQDGEDAHAEQRAQWQQFAPRRLFADEKLLPPGASRSTRSESRIGVSDVATERGVRWEGDSAKPGMVTNSSTESFAGERSPVPRRSRTGDVGEGSAPATGSGINTSESESGRSPPPVALKNNSPMVPRKLPMSESSGSVSAAASYENDREREMARYRLQAQGGSAANTTESAGAETRTGTGVNSGVLQLNSMGGRTLSVPALPERLNALSHITHPPARTPILAPEPSSATGSRPPGQTQSDFLIERLMRTIAPQDSGTVFGSPAPTGAGIGGREDGSGALAVDAVEAMAQLLAASRYPRELQEETHGLFARLSKSIAPSSRVALPVSLVTLRPRELVGCAKPEPVTSSTVATAKANLALHKQRLLAGGASDGAASGQLTPTGDSSSLFYDPFAAKRLRQLAQTQKNEVLWAVGQRSSFVAVLSNPLCVPVFLTSVFPVLTGGEHTIYPIAVHIPPNVERYEVELFVLPRAVGALQVEGLQFIVNNATHVLRVDKEGKLLVDPDSASAKVQKKLISTENVATASFEPAATNAISVVPASAPLRLHTSWMDATEADASVPANWPPADAVRHLTISPGEVREEVVWLSAVTTGSLGAEQSFRETHFRVAIRHAQTNLGAPAKSLPPPALLRAYTGVLCGSEGVVTRPFCAVESPLHNPCPTPPSCASNTTIAPTASVLTSLALSLQHDVSVDMFDLEVEVCSAPPTLLRAIEVFKQDSSAGPEADEMAASLDASELALYARTYRLRVVLRRTPCVALRSLALVHSAIAMPVPQYEVARLRNALQKLLDGCAALRKDRKDAANKVGLLVNLAPKYLQVWAEVENKSDWEASIQILPGNGEIAAGASSERELADSGQIVDASKLQAHCGKLLQLPPHSVRGVILRYPGNANDTAAHVPEVSHQLLQWSCLDLARVFQTPESGGCVLPQAPPRHGAVQLQDAPVDLARHSAQMAPLIRTVPGIVVTTALSSTCSSSVGAGGVAVSGQALTAVQSDSSRGDMFAVSAGKFYDVAIAVRNCGAESAVGIELALCVVNNDVPLLTVQDNEREAQAASSGAGRGPAPAGNAAPQLAAEYLLTGKSYGTYTLARKGDGAQGGAGEPAVHRVRLCFPRPGSFTIYPMVRALSTDSEGWWCSEGSYVRIISS